MLRRTLLAAFLTALTAVSAVAQVPTTLPANSVLGRLGVTPGKPQAIPFATLYAKELRPDMVGDCILPPRTVHGRSIPTLPRPPLTMP
jgi:hypothetical protein